MSASEQRPVREKRNVLSVGTNSGEVSSLLNAELLPELAFHGGGQCRGQEDAVRSDDLCEIIELLEASSKMVG